MVGEPEVVVRQVRDQVANRLPQDRVAVGPPEAGRLGKVEHPQPVVAEGLQDLARRLVAAVTHDEKLEVRHRLHERAADGKAEDVRAGVGREQDAEARTHRATRQARVSRSDTRERASLVNVAGSRASASTSERLSQTPSGPVGSRRVSSACSGSSMMR